MELLAGSEKRFFDFFADLTEKDRIALISHTDLDGLVSALAIYKVVGKAEYIEFIDYSADMIEKILPQIKKRKINKIIFTDISIDGRTKGLDEIRKLEKILIIDHHQFDKDINSDNLICLKTESKIPASYICYSLLSRIQNLEAMDWLVASSVLSDWCYDKNKEFVDGIMKKYILDGRKSDEEDIRKTRLWRISCNLSLFIIYFREKLKVALEIINNLTLNDLDKINAYSDIVNLEIKELAEKFKKEKTIENYGYYWKFNSKFKIKSYLINEISNYDPSKIFVLTDNEGDLLRISMRGQHSTLNFSDILKKATANFKNSSAGGHKNAAGAEIMPQDEEKLKGNLRKIFNES